MGGRKLHPSEPNTDQLLVDVSRGDDSARERLFDRHRHRLRGMVAVRMDPRLKARVDPSDLVQESLAEAHRRLDDYLRKRPMPFYPWLRQIAVDRLIDQHRRHIRSGKRTVDREHADGMYLSDGSIAEFAKRLSHSASAPSARLRREENQERLRTALACLADRDREVLVLRYLEQLAPRDVAAILGISERAESMRHMRALERLRRLLGHNHSEG
jgi:RNA polymerase sigma-70 factor (ECF subfamily)